MPLLYVSMPTVVVCGTAEESTVQYMDEQSRGMSVAASWLPPPHLLPCDSRGLWTKRGQTQVRHRCTGATSLSATSNSAISLFTTPAEELGPAGGQAGSARGHRDCRRAPEARPGHCGAERGPRAAARRQRARQVGGRGGLHLDMFAKLEFKEFVCFPVTAAFALRALWLHLHASVCRSLAHGPDERAKARLWPLAEMLRALGRRALSGRLEALERVARR